ncbi:MAG TPA: response regulator [Allosphingosinicella sp.]|nr:response regulator [Allosphingosinicella sp.]
MTAELAGRRILVVEDSPVVAVVLEEILLDLGCEVGGPIGNMAFAVEFAESEALDGAIIDLNIRGGKVYPVAEVLAARGIPFLLASGYADWSMPEQWQSRPRLAKPYTRDTVEQELIKLFAAESSDD